MTRIIALAAIAAAFLFTSDADAQRFRRASNYSPGFSAQLQAARNYGVPNLQMAQGACGCASQAARQQVYPESQLATRYAVPPVVAQRVPQPSYGYYFDPRTGRTYLVQLPAANPTPNVLQNQRDIARQLTGNSPKPAASAIPQRPSFPELSSPLLEAPLEPTQSSAKGTTTSQPASPTVQQGSSKPLVETQAKAAAQQTEIKTPPFSVLVGDDSPAENSSKPQSPTPAEAPTPATPVLGGGQ